MPSAAAARSVLGGLLLLLVQMLLILGNSGALSPAIHRIAAIATGTALGALLLAVAGETGTASGRGDDHHGH